VGKPFVMAGLHPAIQQQWLEQPSCVSTLLGPIHPQMLFVTSLLAHASTSSLTHSLSPFLPLYLSLSLTHTHAHSHAYTAQDMHALTLKTILEHLRDSGLVTGSTEDLMANDIGALFMPHGGWVRVGGWVGVRE